MMNDFLNARVKQFFLFCALIFISSLSFGQNSVAIGSDTPKSNAVLWLNGNGSQGLLLPSTDDVNKIATTDAPGMVVYQTSDNKVYYYNGTSWVAIGAGGSSGGDAYSLRLQGGNLELLINGSLQDQISLATSGDLSGDITAATLVSIQGAAIPSGTPASADQILVYNGASWEYQALPSGTFSGVSVDGTTITGDGLTTPLSVVSVDDADADPTNEIQDATGVAVTATADLVSTNVQAALEELQTELLSGGSTDDQVASEVPVTPSGNLAATETQGALDELQSDVDAINTALAADTDADPTNEIQIASGVAVTPTGNLAAADVQSALVELQTDIDGIGSAPAVINDLTDVVITTPATNQVLQYDGANWINSGNVVLDTENPLAGDIAGTFATGLSINANTIVNADVNTNAAISGSKINPDFGNQNVVTTGSVTPGSYNLGVVGITAFSTDGTLAGNLDTTLPTEKAIKTYVDTQVGAIPALPTMFAGQLIIGQPAPVAMTMQGDASIVANGTLTIANTAGNNITTAINNAATTTTINPVKITNNGNTRSLLSNSTTGVVSWIAPSGDNQLIGTNGAGNLTFIEQANFIDKTAQTGILVGGSGAITGVAPTANAIFKGDGTTLVASNITDDGTIITLGSEVVISDITTAPGTTTDKLYNNAGDLFWNGNNLTAGTSLQAAYNGGQTIQLDGTAISVTNTGSTEIFNLNDGGTLRLGTAAASLGGIDLQISENNSNSTPLMQIQNIGAGDASLRFWQGGLPDVYTMGVDGTDNFFKISNGNQLGTNDRLVIDNTGQVGIGAADPQRLLHINGSSTVAFASFSNTNTGAGFLQGLRIGVNGSNAEMYLQGAAGNLNLGTNNTARITINNTGNVGIGTSTPLSKFQIDNSFSIFNNSGGDYITHNTYQVATDDIRHLSGGGASAINMQPERIGFFTFPTGAANAALGTFTTRMNFTNDGLVINGDNLDASSVLDINSTTKGLLMPRMTTTQRDAISSPATALMLFNTSTSAFNYYDGAAWTSFGGGASPWLLNGSDAYYNSGNVGIGTSTPNAFFNLDIESNNTNGFEGGIRITGTKTGATNNLFGISTDMSAAATTGTKFGIYSNGEDANYFSGKVGIGTTTPNAPLQFSNAFPSKKIVFFEGGNNDHQYYGFGMAASELQYRTDKFDADHVFYSAIDASSSLELMRIKGGGNVGIGTTSPVLPLQVDGNDLGAGAANSGTAATGSIRITTGGIPALDIGIADDAYLGAWLQAHNPTNQSINYDLLLNPNGGNVGVGTTAPSAALDVVGNVEVNGELHSTNTGAANMMAVAYAVIESDGTLNSGNSSNIALVDHTGTGVYNITITGVSVNFQSSVTSATLVGVAGFIHVTSNAGKLQVQTRNTSGALTNMRFSFVVFKP